MRRIHLILIGATVLVGGSGLLWALLRTDRAVSPAPPPPAPGPQVVYDREPVRPPAAEVVRPPPVEAEEALRRLATERDAMARRHLVQGVAQTPDPLPGLRSAFDANEDGAVREEAMIQAARLGSPEAVRWLAELAARDPKLGARAGAALGSIASQGAAHDLVKLATGDGPVLVRANAARALTASGSKAHAGPLGKLVADAQQPLRVRQESALALQKIGDDSVVDGLDQALTAASADASPDGEQLRLSIIQALGGIRSPGARKALERHAPRASSVTEKAFLKRALSGG